MMVNWVYLSFTQSITNGKNLIYVESFSPSSERVNNVMPEVVFSYKMASLQSTGSYLWLVQILLGDVTVVSLATAQSIDRVFDAQKT